MNNLHRNLIVRNFLSFRRIFRTSDTVDFGANGNCRHFSRQSIQRGAGVADSAVWRTKAVPFQHGLLNLSLQHTSVRCKSKKAGRTRNEREVESDDEDDDDNNDANDFREGNKGDKQIKKLKLNSLRLDAIIASGTNISKK